ncbi:hypothetical protein ACFYUV_34085 [Nonomuraea sp. NPDC003560]|uniref:hypothetical protein n=1 Tax=Nonomuraea sp. NPDC003560 TaxID=3364341 RepID=UPI0036B8F9BC
MSDECFGHPRLAAIHDPLDPDRRDLDAYLRMAEEFKARRVLDIGCGTGVFALLLADHGERRPGRPGRRYALAQSATDRAPSSGIPRNRSCQELII